jgi:competence ComEA-like helix-hairpin-helix protein
MKMKMLSAKLAAIAALLVGIGGTWNTASAAPAAAMTMPAAAEEPHVARKSSHKDLTGKLNLNTATEEQLMLLPAVGPAKADRIVAWRKKNGGFKRVADLRHVKGFGYKSFKKLEPFLDIKGDTTLAPK